MANIIVLAGGTSSEREVSLRSGAAVSEALRSAGYTVTERDPAGGLDALLPELKKANAVFPALHGEGGEDGVLQKFLQANHIAYVGSDDRSSELCFDKAKYTDLLVQNNILVPETKLVKYDDFKRSSLSRKPYVLKPNEGGSSIDTFIVRDPAGADMKSIERAFAKYQQLLLQPLIGGTEVTVAILGEEPLPVIEIIPPAGGEFDYENKYNGRTQELCPPQHINEALQLKAQTLAKQVHDLTGCYGMSRTDIIVTNADQLYVLETNVIPGLTRESLLPKAAQAAGYGMPELCKKLVELALTRNT
ncbi:MAG TPA: D-alanine--D-alanine ligase [Candidatus Saccharimonadales bacterium]|nr:D-alanine--D-alanine ligase [Candidatus Saccharimonadales bacterium]